MARIKFDILDRYPFETQVQIYTSHINHGNHLDNAQLLTLVSEARVRFLLWLGWSEVDVAGMATVVGDVAAQYVSEGFYGETLRIQMAPADLNRYGFDVCFRITETNSGRDVARGKVGVVLIDKSTHKPSLMPEAVRQKLLSL